MACTRDTLPIVDEDGISTLARLDDHDFGLTTTTPAIGHNAANADHLVFAGMGVPSECCNIPVTMTAAVHEQEQDRFTREGQSYYPNPQPTRVNNPYFVTPPAQHQPPSRGQHNPNGSLNARVPAFVPARSWEGNWSQGLGQGQEFPTMIFQNTTPAVIEDQLRARATPAASLARHALQTLEELGPAQTRNNFSYPLTGPDTFPESALVFVQEHPYNPGMGCGGSHTARGERRVSVASSRGSTLSATTQRSLAETFECSFRPCKRTGEIATFRTAGECNKHERRVHGPREDRPHACDICGDRFNHPNEVHRHADAKHSDVPATAMCSLCPSSFKHRFDHLDRHLESSHPLEWTAIKEARGIEKRSVSSSSVANPMTPSTTSRNTSSAGLGLLTPPPSRGSYQSEFPCLPPSPSRT